MRHVRAIAVALLLVTVHGWPTGAQVFPQHARIAQALELARVCLEAQRAYDQIPGVSAAIVHDQQVLWTGGYGYADLAAGRPAAPDTMYSICSLEALHERGGHAAARHGQAAARRPRGPSPALVRHQALRG